MYLNKFLTFGLSTLIELAGGVSYAFSLYSPALKESLQYTQVEMQSIANPLLPSLVLGILPGFAYDALQRHNRFGPRFALMLGGVLHFSGYMGIWLAGTHRINRVSYWVVLGMGVIAMNGASWTDVACISANVRNFPHDRGTVIGILKSMMGLSASVFTTIYSATLRPHALSFLLVIACSLPLLVVVAAPIFNAVPFRQVGELAQDGSFWSNGLRFTLAYGVVGLLAVFMLFTANFSFSGMALLYRSLILGGIAAILSPMLLFGFGAGGLWAKPALTGGSDVEDVADSSPLLQVPLLDGAGTAPITDTPTSVPESSKQQWPIELTPRESLTQLKFWLLFFIFGSGAACGLLFLNNAGQLVQALEGPEDGQDPLLTLFSVMNCLGRLLFGFAPEYALHLWGTPRTVSLVGVSVCMALTTLLTAQASLSALWFTSPVCGLLYGAHWSLMPALASEFFGLSHFGFNYCLLSTSVTITSFVVSNMVGGLVYQARIKQHGDESNICIGADCFRATFIAAAVMEGVAVIASIVLLRSTAFIYAQEHREIVHEEETVLRSPITGHRLTPQRAGRAN